MIPGRHDLLIYRGDVWAIQVQIQHADLTPLDTGDATFAAQWRPAHDSPTFEDMLVTLLDVGLFRIALTGIQTRRMQNGIWDFEMRGDVLTDPQTLLQGDVTVRGDATQLPPEPEP